MGKRPVRNALAGVAVASMILAPAVPAAAQTYDCYIPPIGPSHIPEEVIDCVYYIMSAIAWPPH
ncbi:MAG: hypothetical protein M3323_11665 [Actinomycetota bacterium]|nr:hypothetical protein [Actinomycetota bacterium]